VAAVSDTFNFILFIGGASIFVASVLYAREVIRFKQDMRRLYRLERRAVEAGYLHADETQAELANVSREIRTMIEATSRDHSVTREPRDSSKVARSKVSSTALPKELIRMVERIEQELAVSDERLINKNREIKEELARLREQIALLDRQ
jgi:hypothetical protein